MSVSEQRRAVAKHRRREAGLASHARPAFADSERVEDEASEAPSYAYDGGGVALPTSVSRSLRSRCEQVDVEVFFRNEFRSSFALMAGNRQSNSDVYERKKRSATFTSEASHGGFVRRVAVPGDDDERAKTRRRRVPRETGESG